MQPSLSLIIHFLPQLEQIEDFRLHFYRRHPGIIIDCLEIVDTIVCVVNIVKLMVIYKFILKQFKLF